MGLIPNYVKLKQTINTQEFNLKCAYESDFILYSQKYRIKKNSKNSKFISVKD